MIAMRRKGELGGTVYEPTPKDIRRACEQLQATWSPQERAKRYRGPCAAWWIPPTIRLSGLFEAVNEGPITGPCTSQRPLSKATA
jgi:hypothetical protein